jgi:hypothetical protein
MKLLHFVTFFSNLSVLHISFVAGAVGAGARAASCYSSGSMKIMRLWLHNTGMLGNGLLLIHN